MKPHLRALPPLPPRTPQLLLLPSSDGSHRAGRPSHTDDGPIQTDYGPAQGSQGLLQTLLDLGESFLATEIGEEDLQDLEAKLSAARSRDYGTIRDLQKKIDELSGMSAMVFRLKNELKEEKARAREDAEDLTQEMAELRYQLMQRVDEERELRARTEEASLRRISELEAQLKHARQENSLLLGRKQSAEVQAQAQATELQHLKAALQETKTGQARLLGEKEEAEEKLRIQQHQLESKINAMDKVLSEAQRQLLMAGEKLWQLEHACDGLRKENESLRHALEQEQAQAQKVVEQAEAQRVLELAQAQKVLEERMGHSEPRSHFSYTDTDEVPMTIEEKSHYLMGEVADMLRLVADFKLQLHVLALEYNIAEIKGKMIPDTLVLNNKGSDPQDHKEGPLSSSLQDLSSRGMDYECTVPIDPPELSSQCELDLDREHSLPIDSPDGSFQGEGYHETLSLGATNAEHDDGGSECSITTDLQDLSSQVEHKLDHGCLVPTSLHELSSHGGEDNLDEGGLAPSSTEGLSSQAKHDSGFGHPFSSCGKGGQMYEGPWTVQVVVAMVDAVTEEMTKLLRLLLKHSQSRNHNVLDSLESRLHLWSNIPQKALPEKVVGFGVLSEWGDLVVDLLAQSRREMHSMHQTIGDLEAEVESSEKVRSDFLAVSKEAMAAKGGLARVEVHFTNELALKDNVIRGLQERLEETNLALLQAQQRVEQQEQAITSLWEQVQDLELDMESSKSLWELERKRTEEDMEEQHQALQKERKRTNKEMDKLEKMVDELRVRLAENEQELEELVQANDINIDAVVAAKLRQLDQKLKASQLAEDELQAERSELASQVVWLQAKLEEAERELQAENEQHVEALIQYEEERDLLEAELEAGKQRNAAGGRVTARDGDLHIERLMDMLKRSHAEKDQLVAAQKEELLGQKEMNGNLINQVASLESELLSVRQELLYCESQVAELEATMANLQETLLLERMRAEQAQADIDMQARRQDEDYSQFKLRLDELMSNIKLMQKDLSESRRREVEASAQVRKLGLELSLEKEEVGRLQKTLKQKEEQLDAEIGRLKAALVAQKQAEWRLHKQAEFLRSVERERDDFKAAYVDLECQLSRRRFA